MALFKNKENDKKRKGENAIGKIIYGFLLFAPLMSILFTSLYTIFNKNAYESYYGETINEQIDVPINYTELRINERYCFSNNGPISIAESTNSTTIYVKLFSMIGYGTNGNPSYSINDVDTITVWRNSNQVLAFDFNKAGTTGGYYLGNTSTNLYFEFEYLGRATDRPILSYLNQNLYHITYNKYSYLDNAFEYGMYKTEQSNIYNWSKSTGTYTVLQNVCTGIGITNTFVPMLMAYWLLISIIYFLFDIALILIWAVHDKIHALKDAI